MNIKTFLTILCGITVASCTESQTVKPELKFGSNGKFRIMQVTDLHYHYQQPEYAASTLVFIREAVERVKPDLIMVTGDVVVSADTRKAWQDIAGVLNESKTPWAVVLGNHDNEYELTNRQIIDLLTEYSYCLAENGPEDIFGNGNYVLTVAPSSPNGKTAAAALYCFDSGKQHEYLRYDQMNWYRNHGRRFAAENGGNPLPSLAFYHVPVPEYKEIVGKPTTFGVQIEEVCSPTLNSGSFVAMLECGDVMGVFVGHDHHNNYIGCLHNICLAYGYKSGRQSYGDSGRGVRVIELHEGERKFTTWLMQLYECDHKEKTWIPIENVEPQLMVTYPDSFIESK
jgi:hypothetical protein